MFHLQTLKKHSLALALYASILNMFNLEMCSPAWRLITAQMVDIILIKMMMICESVLCRPPTPE